MNTSTFTKRAIRATSLGALALAILAASANSSFAQFTTTLPGLNVPSGPSYVISEPPVPGGPDLMTVNIANATFSGAPFEIDMIETSGQFTGHTSDRILFDNTGTGNTALITFLSDDESGNLPTISSSGVVFPFYPAISVPDGMFTTSVLMADLSNNPYTLTAIMISDDPNNPNPILGPNDSDALILSAVPTPEPSTVILAGLGLAALAGLAYRRSRKKLLTVAIPQIALGLFVASMWAATAHASTVFSAAAGQLGAAYDNTNLMPIGVPATSVVNAPQTFTNLNPTVDYSYSTDGSTNASAGFTPDFHWIGSGATTQAASPFWKFASPSKNYYLYETTDHTPVPDEGLEMTLWGSNDGGSTWNLGTVATVYELGWSLSGVPDDGSTAWTFGVAVDLISATAGLTQNAYSFNSGSPPDYEVDAIMQSQVPEPGSAALLLVGVASMLAWRKFRK